MNEDDRHDKMQGRRGQAGEKMKERERRRRRMRQQEEEDAAAKNRGRKTSKINNREQLQRNEFAEEMSSEEMDVSAVNGREDDMAMIKAKQKAQKDKHTLKSSLRSRESSTGSNKTTTSVNQARNTAAPLVPGEQDTQESRVTYPGAFESGWNLRAAPSNDAFDNSDHANKERFRGYDEEKEEYDNGNEFLPTAIEAEIVKEKEEVPVFEATKFDADKLESEKLKKLRQRNRCIIIVLIGVAILAIVLGSVFGTQSRVAPGTDFPTIAPTTSFPSSIPSAFPTETPPAPWIQIGTSLVGMNRDEMTGKSIALSSDGNRIVVGEQFYDAENGAIDAGRIVVYAFISAFSQFAPVVNIEGTNSTENGWFGDGVAMSGDGEVVAALARSNTTDPSVELYTWLGAFIGVIPNDGFDGDRNTLSFSFDGSILAVGSPFRDVVRVYNVEGGNVTQMGQDLKGRLPNDFFGVALELSSDGMTLIVGAPGSILGGEENVFGTPQTGYAQVFAYSNEANLWTEKGIPIPGEREGDEVGHTVAISADGRVCAMGSVLNDDTGENAGHIRVFRFSDENLSWLPVGDSIGGEAEFDNFGFSLALSADGKTVAAGAPGNKGRDDPNVLTEFNAGHVRVFRLDNETNAWEQVGADIDGQFGGDQSGWDIDLSADGSRIAIGTPHSPGDGLRRSGHVRIFDAPLEEEV